METSNASQTSTTDWSSLFTKIEQFMTITGLAHSVANITQVSHPRWGLFEGVAFEVEYNLPIKMDPSAPLKVPRCRRESVRVEVKSIQSQGQHYTVACFYFSPGHFPVGAPVFPARWFPLS